MRAPPNARTCPAGRGARTGATAIEVAVATSILAIISLALLYATIPASRATVESSVTQDMDREASRVLDEVRRSLRQSGWMLDGTERITAPADGATGNACTFQMRTGPVDPDDWSTPITYARIDDGNFAGVPGVVPRYRVTRTQGGLVVDVGADLGELTFERPAGGSTVVVTLRLVRPNPRWSGTSGQPPDPFVRTYVDRVQVLNPRPAS